MMNVNVIQKFSKIYCYQVYWDKNPTIDSYESKADTLICKGRMLDRIERETKASVGELYSSRSITHSCN